MPIVRWFLVVPTAVAAAMVVAFPIHWLVMGTFGGWGSDPLIEIRDRETLKSIELFLQGLLGPFAFAYVGARTAPSRQVPVSGALGLVVVVGAALLANWAASVTSTPGVAVRYGIVQFLSNLAGAAGAILLVRARRHRV